MKKFKLFVKNNLWTSWLVPLWKFLAEPPAEIKAPGPRRKGRTLSTLLLILIVFTFISIILNIAVTPELASMAELLGIAILLSLYFLSRTKHYLLTSTLLAFLYPVWTMVVLLTIDSQNVDRYLMGLFLSLKLRFNLLEYEIWIY